MSFAKFDMIAAGAAALAIHAAAFGLREPQGGAQSAGDGGSALVSLEASSASVAAMVEAWETPPDVSEPAPVTAPPPPDMVDAPPPPPPVSESRPASAAPRTPTAPAPETMAALAPPPPPPPAPPPPETVALPTAEAPEDPPDEEELEEAEEELRADEAPDAAEPDEPEPELAEDQPPETDPAEEPVQLSEEARELLERDDISPLAPAQVATRPREMPERPDPPPPPPQPKRAEAQPQPKRQQQQPAEPARQASRSSAASAAQRAAGSGGGQNAGGNRQSSVATLSSAQVANLKAQWGASIRNRVERGKRYPSGARRASGTAVVQLTVTRAGGLAGVRLVQSSGNAAIDQAAVQAVQRAGRFPAAPSQLPGNAHSFNLPISFRG
ncbi:energy transducer TonB [Tropicimonas sp. IMCC34011]|uniref:energy transducer TonB family protein n=1 Tax=Tropicimonas sp. IMCC34011 TaxID=2248759 RepID=UPI000E22FD0B|nr:energy transducer TonB [Tropicimonas sp. IMCC34011]